MRTISEISVVDEDEVRPDSQLTEELDIDSIKAIEIVVAIEKKYRVSIRDDDISSVTIVQDILDLTDKLIQYK